MMKSLKYGFAAVALLVATPAWAQTAAEVVRDVVFSEVEKRIIGEHYGVKVQDMVQETGMPDWAVKTDPDTDMEGRDEDERDDDRDKDEDGDKKKGKKNKGDKWGDKGKVKIRANPRVCRRASPSLTCRTIWHPKCQSVTTARKSPWLTTTWC